MAELERLANHLGDIGAICNDASFALMHAHCGILRERVLRAARRLLRPSADDGRVVPGGVARRSRRRRARRSCARLRDDARSVCRAVELYDNTASLQDRTVGTGILRAELARQFGGGGFVGRASGRDFDARATARLSALRQLRLRRAGARRRAMSMRASGSASARSSRASALIEQILAGLPARPDRGRDAATASRRGHGLVEGFRGDVLVWAAA